MKALPWILVVLLLIACMVLWFHPHKPIFIHGKSDTVTVVDTIRDTILEPYKVEVIRFDTIWLPLLTGNDSGVDIPVVLPIERKEYKTNEYKAVISGYRPNLDLMETYNTRQTITVVPKIKRLGLSLQAGYGYPGGFYVGGGVSYNLWMW